MSLPKGYKRLEYIESSGTQYVDTNFIPNQDTRVVAEMEYVSHTDATCGLFGGGISASGRFEAYYYNSLCYFSYASANYTTSATVSAGRKMLIDFSKDSATYDVDGTIIDVTPSAAATFTSSYTMFIHALNRGGASYQSISKTYSFKIYDNGTLVRDYIPCQNADSEIGLWDAVNEVFYGNAGTGTFTAGPIVPESVDESEITELEYIESSGTQYVDTVFAPNQDTRIVMDATLLKLTSSQQGAYLFGSCYPFQQSGFEAFVYNNLFCSAYNGTEQYGSKTVSGTPRVFVDFNKNVCTAQMDGVSWYENTFTYSSFTSVVNLTLFMLPRSTKHYGIIKLYSCQIYDNGLLKRDFVPAMLSNGEVGLYDRVSHEFYRNAGTGEFAAGPEAVRVPSVPANFRKASSSGNSVALAWDAAEDALGYRLYRDGALLADLTETRYTDTVEIGVTYTYELAAYNDMGEGAASVLLVTLKQGPIPPVTPLKLVTDRTQEDVDARNEKGVYRTTDLNRVGEAMLYVSRILEAQGYVAGVSPKTDWTDEEWPTPSAMSLYLVNLTALRNAVALFASTPAVPAGMERLTYQSANDIERILEDIDARLRLLSAVWFYSGDLYAGEV